MGGRRLEGQQHSPYNFVVIDQVSHGNRMFCCVLVLTNRERPQSRDNSASIVVEKGTFLVTALPLGKVTRVRNSTRKLLTVE